MVSPPQIGQLGWGPVLNDNLLDLLPAAEKGAAGGVAALGTDGKVPDAQLPSFARRPDADGWPVYVYGNSYGVLAGAWFTSGKHYAQQAAEALQAGTVTSYAVGGRRIVDVCCTLHNGTAVPGTNGVVVAGEMPADDSRKGLMVLDSMVNDAAHYPAMNVAVAQPTTITSANTRYLDGVKAMYRAAIALLAGGTRVEHGSAAFTGTWTNTNLTTAYASGGSLAYSTTVGATATYTVTPPQSGPLRGKVFHIGYRLDPAVGTSAAYNVSVDGGAATLVPNSGWEQYTGHGGTNIHTSFECVTIDVPVDGAAHTVAVSHAGSAGQFFYSDCLLIPSSTPNPVAVMGLERPPAVNANLFTQANINAYVSNMKRMDDAVKGVVAEFGNAYWVPSTMTPGGLYSADSLHPNDRGMTQRANDLIESSQHLRARLRSRELDASTDFGIL